MVVVISYDLADDARRGRVSAALADVGTRVQYSVFELRLEGPRIDAVVARLEAMMDPDHDSLRVYPLCTRCARSAGRFGTPLAEPPGPGALVV
jgi:CRISPR-associated protein Cas2